MALFEKHIHHETKGGGRTQINANVKVKEKRAPTDESVRLLNEMQEKARENILATIKVDDNKLKAIGIFFQEERTLGLSHGSVILLMRFTLNEIEYTVKRDFSNDEYRKILLAAEECGGHSKWFQGFLSSMMAKAISEQLFEGQTLFLHEVNEKFLTIKKKITTH